MWNNSNSYILLVGMQDDIATLENRLAVSLKFKHTPSRSTHVFIREKVKQPFKDLYLTIHTSFICNR